METMALSVFDASGVTIVEGARGEPLMQRPQDATLVIEACLSAGTRAAMLFHEHVTPRFFDLSSGEAGDVLDKLRRYGVRLAIVCAPGTVRFSRRFREILSDDLGTFRTRRQALRWLTGDPGPIDRTWTRAGLDPAAFEALSAGLAPTALWSLLLDVFAARAASRQPADLLRQHARDPFTRPSAVDQRTLVELDAHLLAAADRFEAVELSPLAPLGACSGVALTSQHRVVSAVRGTEVVGDPTNVLALEAAHRLRQRRVREVHLATSHRCVRAQAVPKIEGFAQHFRIFCLASAGAERADHGFTVEALVGQIRTHLAALDRLERHGYAFPGRRLAVLASPARAALGDRVAAAVTGLPVSRGVLEHAYYDGLRFRIDVAGTDGSSWPLVDGGAFGWLRALTSNRKMVLVASGLGSQLAAFAFRPRESSPRPDDPVTTPGTPLTPGGAV